MVRLPRKVRRTLALSLLVSAGLATGACGGSNAGRHGGATTSHAAATSTSSAAGGKYPAVTPGPAVQGPYNDADVQFATGMIPHHGQAVMMADMVLATTSNPQVKKLAEDIKAAQGPEINAMAGWLKGWGAPVPDPYADLGHGASGMEGSMMTAEQMSQLQSARGVDADKMFLTMMPEHHRGAITMAQQEIAKGSNPDAKKTAQSIIDSQTAEIETMRQLLGRLS